MWLALSILTREWVMEEIPSAGSYYDVLDRCLVHF